MKRLMDGIEGPIGWGAALALALVSLPLAAVTLLLVRAFLIPLLVGAVVVMALLALFVPPRFRDWIGPHWHAHPR